MDKEMPQPPNKANNGFSKLGTGLSRKPDNSGFWERDGFACDELHGYAVYGGGQELADQPVIAFTCPMRPYELIRSSYLYRLIPGTLALWGALTPKITGGGSCPFFEGLPEICSV